MSAEGIALTPLRLAWLQALAENGPMRDPAMPKTPHGRAAGATTWGPMVEAGFIEIGQARAPLGAEFTITDTGRAVLAKALRVAANQGNDDAI